MKQDNRDAYGDDQMFLEMCKRHPTPDRANDQEQLSPEKVLISIDIMSHTEEEMRSCNWVFCTP